MSTDARISREKDFHDERYRDGDSRQAQNKYYSALVDCFEDFERDYLVSSEDLTVLDYGCGEGERVADLVARAYEVYAIDISQEAIDNILKTKAGNAFNMYALVENAESTSFLTDSIEYIVGSGILHHLDYNRAYRELNRICSDCGKATFIEPLAYNPFIWAYRKLTPNARSEDEHPMRKRDIDHLRKYFKTVKVTHYGLFTLLGVPFREKSFHGKLHKALRAIDKSILKLPLVKWLSWYVMIEAYGPKKDIS